MKLVVLFAAVCSANAIELGESINFEDLPVDDSLDESIPAYFGFRRRTNYPTHYPTGFPTTFPTAYPTIPHPCESSTCDTRARTSSELVASGSDAKLLGTVQNWQDSGSYTGSSSGCQWKTSIIGEYQRDDGQCLWESTVQSISSPENFDRMYVKFTAREYGSLENDDFVKVSLRTCTSSSASSCSGWFEVFKLQDDFGYQNMNQDTAATSYEGHAWTSGIWSSKKAPLKATDNYVQARIQFQNTGYYGQGIPVWTSSSDREYQYFDNLEVWGDATRDLARGVCHQDSDTTHSCSCRVGYTCSGAGCTQCLTYGGSCANGDLIAQSQRSQENHCGSCNGGYYLNNRQCLPYEGSCANGDLIAQSQRTQENHCGSCNDGHYLENKQCPLHPCSLGTDTCDKSSRDAKDLSASCQQELVSAVDFSAGTVVSGDCSESSSSLQHSNSVAGATECVWESAQIPISHPHAFEYVYVAAAFLGADGEMSNGDNINVTIRGCSSSGGSCGEWENTLYKSGNFATGWYTDTTAGAGRAALAIEHDRVQMKVVVNNDGAVHRGFDDDQTAITTYDDDVTADVPFSRRRRKYCSFWGVRYRCGWRTVSWTEEVKNYDRDGESAETTVYHQNYDRAGASVDHGHTTQTHTLESFKIWGAHSTGDCSDEAQQMARGVCTAEATKTSSAYTCSCISPQSGDHFPAVDHQMSYVKESDDSCIIAAGDVTVSIEIPDELVAMPEDGSPPTFAPGAEEVLTQSLAATYGVDADLITIVLEPIYGTVADETRRRLGETDCDGPGEGCTIIGFSMKVEVVGSNTAALKSIQDQSASGSFASTVVQKLSDPVVLAAAAAKDPNVSVEALQTLTSGVSVDDFAVGAVVAANDDPGATSFPTKFPTPSPTSSPTPAPTHTPTTYPTPVPTTYPTPYPTSAPTTYPTPSPTNHICLTNQHNCDSSVGGVCYTPGAADYASAVTDHDEGVNGVDDHNLDANVWVIPAHSEVMAYDTDGDTTHVYKCGCKEGYNCVAGCSPPFTGHTCEMTQFPTPYPTSAPTTYPTPYPTPYPTSSPTPSPTPAPTAHCPVTCALQANELDRRSHTHDANWNQALHSHAGDKVQVTHNVYDINTQNTYKQHRCYRTDGGCLCECIDSVSNIDGLGFFEQGAEAGHMPRADASFYMPDQDIHNGISSTPTHVVNPQLLTDATEDDEFDMVNFWTGRTKEEADSKANKEV